MNNKILVYPDSEMTANEFVFILEKLKCSSLVLAGSDRIRQRFQSLGNSEIKCLYSCSVKDDSSTELNANGLEKRKQPSIQRKGWFIKLLLTPIRVLMFYRRYLMFKKMFRGQNIASAIIPSDRSYADGYLMSFIYYCKRHGVNLVIPQTAAYANKESMLQVRLKQKGLFFPTIVERLFFRRYIGELDGRQLVYYPFDILLTFKIFGLLSKNPWVMGGNSVAVTCVNNEQTKKTLVAEGVDSNMIRVTGSYKFLQPVRNKDLIEINTIGFALPQLFEHNLLPWKEHIQSIEIMLDLLCKKDLKLEIFLHPKMKSENYQYLEDKYACKISNCRTDDRIPELDLYIATYSSTVMTALVYGVPSLVIDSFNAEYKMFDAYPSVKIYKSQVELFKEVELLVEDTSEYKKRVIEARKDGEMIEPCIGSGIANLARELRVGL